MKIVVVDIDGTIAKPGKRLEHLQKSPKDWDAFYADCFEDEPIPPMVEAVRMLSHHYKIIFCTGRRESVRGETSKWLAKYLPEFQFKTTGYTILMRPNGDRRHDTITKPEVLHAWLDKDWHNFSVDDVAFVLEDRNSMVSKWREMGLTCLQVAEGDF